MPTAPENCSNCNSVVNLPDGKSMVVAIAADVLARIPVQVVAVVCPACQENVNLLRLDLRRGPDGKFKLAQFFPVEMATTFGTKHG